MSTERRVAIVTGAAQGIGRAVALRLADDGIDVAVNDLQSNADILIQLVAELQAKGRKSIPILADVSDEEGVKAIVTTTVQQLGKLDIMVANAGICALGLLHELDVEQWDRVVAVNLRGTMLCYKYAAAQMIKQGHGGRIIGASSYTGKKGEAYASVYCTTKFAIRGLTQSLAMELLEHKITVNAYAPGVIDTPMARRTLGGGGKAEWAIGAQPLEGAAEPDVVGSIVSYLVKPEAYFITGQSLNVNGGIYMD
ncbi:uncharacterized protein FIBRA_03281 [Fibroporia radiculosa]|uniref:Uncharacterized protein n=1 Tax=Fibroporia radiculosa TaxID=599839 RepID=J4G4V1_9APHY|nr:uncharacterized protein FIBRA_03281 [Fibroporia radiculosa]CCM01233.1 predicted protein [Fibroporia radiculosa]